jgi:hypothetical protein
MITKFARHFAVLGLIVATGSIASHANAAAQSSTYPSTAAAAAASKSEPQGAPVTLALCPGRQEPDSRGRCSKAACARLECSLVASYFPAQN